MQFYLDSHAFGGSHESFSRVILVCQTLGSNSCVILVGRTYGLFS